MYDMADVEDIIKLWYGGLFHKEETDTRSTYVPKPTFGVPITIHEWEIGDKVVTTKISIMDRFIKEATEKWQRGVEEHRGGDEELEFNGDPLEEITSECLDIYAYSKVAAAQGKISESEQDMLNCFAYDAYKLVRRIQNHNDEPAPAPTVEASGLGG